VSDQPDRTHYSYTAYAEPEMARTFDERRFGGAIGAIVSGTQSRTLADAVGRIQGRTILDVGTGTGRAAIFLARGGAKVTAIDASEQMLDVARQRAVKEGVSVTFQRGDAHKIEAADRSFEVVVCFRLLMHLPQWQTCIHELCRVSEQLVILDYPSARSMAVFQSIYRRLISLIGVKTEAYRALSDRAVSEALQEGGFRVRSVHRMFVLPIGLHKMVGSRRLTISVEHALSRFGLRKVFGSPVTLVAERWRSS
jgi:2-polyprenyl-3-methyl-5-hydroxy-6-metoxy-1,4-benzoquinol methylase